MDTEQFIQLSDQELLTKIKSGQESFFVILYDRHAAAAYRHILFRSQDKEIAEDVVSQAFLRTWDYLRQGQTIESFRAFLFQTARNIFIDTIRKRDFKNLSLDEILEEKKMEPANQDNPLEDIIIAEEVGALRQALAALPEQYSEIITLRYLDELSIPEIAKITGKNSGAIYVSLHRGIRLLRQALVEATAPAQ